MADTDIDAIAAAAGEEVGQLNEAAVEAEANQPDAPKDGEVVEPSGGEGEVDPAALVKKLEERDKSYNELRSLHDRQMQELREQQNAMNERLVAALEKATAQPQAAQKDPSEVYKQWGERINPDDPEQGATIAEMMDSLGRGWLEKFDARINEVRGTTEQRIQALDPDYRQNKEVVDELVSNGMPFDKALSFAKKHPANKAPAQPGAATAPGRTATGTKAAPAAAATPKPVAVGNTERSVMRMALGQLGVKDIDKEINSIAAEVAKEQA